MGGSMIKRFFLALALSAGLLSPAYSAGTISLSLTQQLDNATQKPLAGGKLYFFQAGTSTPQIAYQDTALTIPLPGGSVYTLDAGGRIPQFFLADGQIKIRLANKAGVTQLAADNILVIGPSAGGGSSPSVDPTTVLTTGDIKATYGTGVLTGFVRANGRTIGSATSGATERANSDAQTLFEYLWAADANLTVSTGRGASANADWVANKQLTLPDWRGQALGALADMGNTATTGLTSTYFGTDPTVLGAAGGLQSRAIAMTNLPASPAPVQAVSGISAGGAALQPLVVPLSSAPTAIQNGTGASVLVFATDKFALINTPVGVSGNTANLGSGTAIASVSPMKLTTIYLKL